MPELIRLADRNPQLLASAIVGQVAQRAARDAGQLGLVLMPANGSNAEGIPLAAVAGSNLCQAAMRLAEWVKDGHGAPDDIARLILRIRATSKGSTPSKVCPRGRWIRQPSTARWSSQRVPGSHWSRAGR
jgi:hypothetical protein